MNTKSNIKKLALGGIFTALSVIFMFLSRFMPFTYIWIMLAGFIMAMLYIEVGQKYTVCAYIATSVVSFLIVPSPFLTLEFAAFYGLYPAVLLPQIMKLDSKKKRFFIKLAVFGVNGLMVFYIGKFITGLNAFSTQLLENGQVFLWVIVALTTIGNYGYDVFLLGMSDFYKEGLRARIVR